MPAIQYSQELMDLRQYESMPEEQRMEVFDGIAYNMASPSQLHQSILTELLVSLRNYIRKNNGGCSVFPAPFDVKLNDSPLTIVQPDLMIVCDRDKLDGNAAMVLPISSSKLYLRGIHRMTISANSITIKIMESGNTGLLTHREKLSL